MVTTPLRNPYETRVLPAVPPMAPRTPTSVLPAAPMMPQRPAPARAPTTTPAARRRLVVELQSYNHLEIWDDRVVTNEQVFALDDTFSARVTVDWRAPLTVEAPLGLALCDYRGRWNIYVPVDEEQLWHAAAVLRGVCAARGLDLPELDPSAVEAETQQEGTPHTAWDRPVSPPKRAAPAPSLSPAHALGQHTYAPTYATPQVRLSAEPRPVRAPGPRYTEPLAAWAPMAPSAARTPLPAVEPSSDTVLIAIAHLSVVFLPVVLPLVIWLALRRSVPAVAGQARQAMGFQAVVAILGALLLGYAVHGALTHASAAAAIGLAGFVALLAVAAVGACYVALRAMRGGPARYLDLIHMFRRA